MSTSAKTIQAKVMQIQGSLTQEQKDAFDVLWERFRDSDLDYADRLEVLSSILGN